MSDETPAWWAAPQVRLLDGHETKESLLAFLRTLEPGMLVLLGYADAQGDCQCLTAADLQPAVPDVEALRVLVKQWRAMVVAVDTEDDEALERRFGTIMSPDGYCQYCATLERCADELAALLGPASEPLP